MVFLVNTFTNYMSSVKATEGGSEYVFAPMLLWANNQTKLLKLASLLSKEGKSESEVFVV